MALPVSTPVAITSPLRSKRGALGPMNTKGPVSFPERAFPPLEETERHYWECVERGYGEMRSRRVVLTGLARNLGPLVTMTCDRLERTGSLFRDYRVVLFENDSADDTAEHLERWMGENRRVTLLRDRYEDPVFAATRSMHRAERMAHYRSRYHDHIRRKLSDFDDVLVVDTDLEGGWSHDGLANTFGQTAAWDVVGSNGMIFRREKLRWNQVAQYDAWAFRRADSDQELSSREVNQMAWSRGAPLVPVRSVFGGMAVYRMGAFLAGSYLPGDCEHVTFHRSLRAEGYGACFLNPSQIVLYGRHHRTADPYLRGSLRFLQRLGIATDSRIYPEEL
jgi:hypothetical protein